MGLLSYPPHILFISCQSALPFQRYSYFTIWPWYYKFMVMGEVKVLAHIPFTRANIQKHGTANVQMARAFGMNPKARVPLRLRHFLSQKLWRFHKNLHSCVENEWCYLYTVNISNATFTLKKQTNKQTIKSHPFHSMSIRHPIPGIWICKKIWSSKSKIKVIAQLYRLTSLLLHGNQHSNSWHALFQNLKLKIQGQGHGWG